MAVGLARLVSAIRQEQLMGTLESLMVTPTTASVILLGSVVYDLIYVPLRTVIFLIIVSIVFNVSFAATGYIPALLILVAFIPFVWGLGSIASACVLTFRRGSGVLGFLAFALTFTSGAYFPLALFPSWVAPLASINPIAIAITGMRAQLIGGPGGTTRSSPWPSWCRCRRSRCCWGCTPSGWRCAASGDSVRSGCTDKERHA